MDDADRIGEATATFLAERADGEQTLERLLAVDAAQDTWTFNDVDLDSGTFGEVVSRGLVEKVDGAYQVTDPKAVQAVLDGEDVPPKADNGRRVSLSNPLSIDLRAAAALVGVLVFLFFMRIVNYRPVFRGEHVVSPANDPYHYRYWMETLLAESNGATDLGVITAMPEGAAGTRPLTHASNWFVAELLGGDQWAAEMVAAWLPVAATLVLGVLIYWLAVIVTDDVRVGLASVVLFALTPVHAVYTGVGFLEHRLYQYLWLGATLVALAWLAVDLQRRRERASTKGAIRGHLLCPWTWLAAPALGMGLTFSAFAWGGSVLMFIPAAAYVGLKVAMDAREGVSPTLANLPVLVGLGVAGGLSAFLHFRWGWHETFTALVPLLVLAGVGVVIVLGELWRRFEWPTSPLVALQGVLAGVGLYAFQRVRPEDWARLHERADDLLLRERYTESVSLFTLDLGIIFGPLAQLGVGFYVGIAVLCWVCWIVTRRYEPGWLLVAVYVGVWLVLATIQVRFAAQLAIPLSVLGGLGLVHLLAWVDLARIPVPFRDGNRDRDQRSGDPRGVATNGGSDAPSVVAPRDVEKAAYLVGIALLVCGMSLLFVPTLSAQTAYDDAQYEAAMAIDEHAEAADREYPANYVLSHWPDNRMYNYFVSGESQLYGYADGHFDRFISDDEPVSWQDQFVDDDVGYVVLTDVDGEFGEESLQVQLHENYGTGSEDTDPLEHYQAVSVDDDATAFAIVPGATIKGEGEPTGSVSIEASLEVGGETIEYEHAVQVRENGTVSVTVPNPGEYSVDGQPVSVTEEDVLEGRTVAVE